MKIQLLDQQIINKIAAGEVVERPASVVKELIENSIDAGASKIEVEIEEGGIHLIKVTDNGCGMSAEDAEMSLQCHATSKIRSDKDLMKLTTLGFRGEALAAISAVSEFRLVTKEADAMGATEVASINDEITVKTTSGTQGTMIEIRGLFHSVPARKKFLKAANTEFKYIHDVVLNQALLTPHIAWKLTHNGKDIFDYIDVADWKDRVSAILGKKLSQDIIEVHHQRASLKIDGFLVHPAYAQAKKKHQYLFVNGRAISDYVITKAVKEAYSHHIPHGTFPAFVLQLSIAPDLVDVNVHPRKSEVKFADASAVFRTVAHAVKDALASMQDTSYTFTPKAHSSQTSHKPLTSPTLFKASARPSTTPSQIKQSFEFQKSVASISSAPSVGRMPSLQDDILQDWKLMGQIHDSFILVQSNDGLLVVDQHAAAEKLLYEKILADKSKPRVQKLLVPIVIDLDPAELALLKDQEQALASLGLEGEEFGGNSYRLTGVPQDLSLKDLNSFLQSLIAEMMEEDVVKIKSLEDRQKALARIMGCRGAIKFGDDLSMEEQRQLLIDIKKHSIISCIHGRPVMLKLKKDELSKCFHRP